MCGFIVVIFGAVTVPTSALPKPHIIQIVSDDLGCVPLCVHSHVLSIHSIESPPDITTWGFEMEERRSLQTSTRSFKEVSRFGLITLFGCAPALNEKVWCE